MTVLLSALSRYHVFDLALQLQGHGLLDGLFTAYPKYKLGRYDALRNRVISQPKFAVARKASLALERLLGPSLSARLHERVYSAWALSYANEVQRRESPVVCGMSGYMLEVLQAAGVRSGRQVVVDHGSLHIEAERAAMVDVCGRYGFNRFGDWQHDWMVRRMRAEFEQADRVVCCSVLAKETMIRYGVSASKIAVHRPGVSLSEFSRRAGRRWRESGRVRIVFAGAITPLKGVHTLLEAFQTLGPDVELWMVGSLPVDPALSRLVEEAVRSTGRVKVIGAVPQAKLNDIYNECDLFVLPSLSDGWGMVVSQALACGLPVVVTDMTGAKEQVIAGQNGLVARSGCALDLAEKLAQAVEAICSGDWQGGVHATDVSKPGQSWDDYGWRWKQWLQEIA